MKSVIVVGGALALYAGIAAIVVLAIYTPLLETLEPVKMLPLYAGGAVFLLFLIGTVAAIAFGAVWFVWLLIKETVGR